MSGVYAAAAPRAVEQRHGEGLAQVIECVVDLYTRGGWEDDLHAAGRHLAGRCGPLRYSVRHHSAGVNPVTYFPGGVDYLTVQSISVGSGGAAPSPARLYAKAPPRPAGAPLPHHDANSPSVPSDTIFIVPYFAEHWHVRCVPERYTAYLTAELGACAPHFIGVAAQLFKLLDALECILRRVLTRDYPPWRTSYCWKHMLCMSGGGVGGEVRWANAATHVRSMTLSAEEGLDAASTPEEQAEDDIHATPSRASVSAASCDDAASDTLVPCSAADSSLTSGASLHSALSRHLSDMSCDPCASPPQQRPLHLQLHHHHRQQGGYDRSAFTHAPCYPATPP